MTLALIKFNDHVYSGCCFNYTSLFETNNAFRFLLCYTNITHTKLIIMSRQSTNTEYTYNKNYLCPFAVTKNIFLRDNLSCFTI